MAPVYALIAVSAILAAASTVRPLPLAAASPALDEPFILRPGELASVGNERVQVAFDEVVSDSRCPKDVQCIQAGEAIVRVQVTVPGRIREQLDVKTTPRNNTVTSGRFVLSLDDLQPVPLAGRPPKPSDYRATFVLRRS